MFGLGDLVAHKARTLDIWPWAVKIDEVIPVERSAEGKRVKETIYEREHPKVSKFRHSVTERRQITVSFSTFSDTVTVSGDIIKKANLFVRNVSFFRNFPPL